MRDSQYSVVCCGCLLLSHRSRVRACKGDRAGTGKTPQKNRRIRMCHEGLLGMKPTRHVDALSAPDSHEHPYSHGHEDQTH